MMFIERDEAMSQLQTLASQVANGAGAIALLRGEAGIGKTTVLREFCAENNSGFQLHWGGCDPLDTPRVLGPVHDMGKDFSLSLSTLLAQDPAFSVLVPKLLNELESSASPTIMIFEDIHWADKATLDLLKCIGRRISFLRTLLILSYRDDELEARHPLTDVFSGFPSAQTHRMALEPISAEGILAFTGDSNVDANQLHTITGGNPFYITELLSSSNDQDYSVPLSVQDAISARLNRLPGEEQVFLESISIIPYALDISLLIALLGDSAERLMENCVQRKLLTQDNSGSLRFRHEIARLGTLERVPKIAQKKFHRKVLEIQKSTSGKSDVDRLAFHAAGAELASEVLHYAPLAASKASNSGAHSEAASHLLTALRYIEYADIALAATLYESWSYEAGLVNIDDQTLEARYKALTIWRKLDRTDKIGENLRWLSRLHWYRGEAQLANQYLDESVAVLESDEPSAERAMAYSLKSQYHMLNDRLNDAIEWGEKALSVERVFENTEIRIHALNNIGTAMLFLDDPKGEEYLQRSLSLSLQHEYHEHAARVYTNLSDYAVGAREFELAEKTLAQGIAFDTSHDLDTWTHYLTGLLAHLRMEQGRLTDAELISQGVMELDQQTLLMKLPALLVMARTRLRMGHSTAQEFLHRALEDALSTGEAQYILPARLGLIESAWMNNSREVALSQFEQLKKADFAGARTWRGAEIALWIFRFNLTERELPLIKYIGKLPEPYQLEVDGFPEKASTAWEKLGSSYNAALALLSCAPTHRSERFAMAFEKLAAMQAHGCLAKVRQLATAYEIDHLLPIHRRGPQKRSRQHPLGLTRREQEIIPLLINGLTNKDISRTLSRSPRTVENHVASILRKFDANNRMEVMLRVNNEPWLNTSADENAHELQK